MYIYIHTIHGDFRRAKLLLLYVIFVLLVLILIHQIHQFEKKIVFNLTIMKII